jgi:hypothetical protein
VFVCDGERGRPKIQNVKSTMKALAGGFSHLIVRHENAAFGAFGMIMFYSP